MITSILSIAGYVLGALMAAVMFEPRLPELPALGPANFTPPTIAELLP